MCAAQNVKLGVDGPLGTCAHHTGFRIKGDPLGQGMVTQAWKGEKGQTIQGASVWENKTWVQFFLHVAPTPPGSGVFFSLFTEFVSVASTTIWGKFAASSVTSISFGQTKKEMLTVKAVVSPSKINKVLIY